MPDSIVRYPEFMFAPAGHQHDIESARIELMELVASSVAKHLDCNDYDDKPLSMVPTDIDVLMVPYKGSYAHMHGAPVVLTITGYDYPSRMSNRKDRLTLIRDELHDNLAELNRMTHFTRRLGLQHIDKLVSIMFIPIPDDCFV